MGKINMGNLRQSMTQEEWNELQKESLLINIIDTKGHPDILSQIIDGPKHYGGKDNTYEAIKVIDAWGLDFALGNVVKYISRAGKKSSSPLEDLEKAKWYICHAIDKLKRGE